MKKKERLELIKKIITENEVENQLELISFLEAAGEDVTQATVSRDINKLRLEKTEGISKKFRYSLPVTENSFSSENAGILKGLVISVVPTNNLIVIRTKTGSANAAANIIDELNATSVLGSIAGDDTILLILSTKKDADNFALRVKEAIKNA